MGGELEITTTTTGNDKSLAKEVKILGRRLVWHPDVGITYGADPKHAEIIVRDTWGVNPSAPQDTHRAGGQGERPSQSAGGVRKKKLGKQKEDKEYPDTEKLGPEDSTEHRALAAKANLLAIDRGDLLFATKELTRNMSAPTSSDWEKARSTWT